MIVKCCLLTAYLVFSYAFFPAAVEACIICSVPLGKGTHTDTYIRSESVILAKKAPAKLNSTMSSESLTTYVVVAVLKGPEFQDRFKAFVPLDTLKSLNRDPEGAVVFVNNDLKEEWLHITYADRDYQAFARTILEQSDQWQKINGWRNRINFFSKYLTSDHPTIRKQACLEIGRLPYAILKTITADVPVGQIRELLTNRPLAQCDRLYILMLGQSQDNSDRDYIRGKLEAAARDGSTDKLSAWVTAFVEAFPDTGIEEIEALYFADQDRRSSEIKAVLISFSVLGSERGVRMGPGIVQRRYRIVKSYAALLENHPMMAGAVASDLTRWKIRAMVHELTNIKEKLFSNLDPRSRYAIDYYISVASKFKRIEALD